MKATIFDIERNSYVDGPGIRTTVFFKGCNLRCAWCHNPETQEMKQQVLRFPQGNDEVCGKEMTAESVVEEVLRDLPFYGDTGGMTLSGGEPMMQAAFSLEVCRLAKEKGLHVCMETSGFGKREDFIAIAPFVDLFLFDYKETDPALHKRWTGVSPDLIRQNLALLDGMGKATVLRCPIIPTCNDREDHFRGIAETANGLSHVVGIDLEPYHPLGESKSERMGTDYPLAGLGFPSEEDKGRWLAAVSAHTKVPVALS